MKNLQMGMWMGTGVVTLMLGAGIGAGRITVAQQIPGAIPGQSGNRQQQRNPSPMLSEPPSETDEAKARLEQQQVKLQIDDRQKHLQSDTARLVQLSTELKDEVDKSGKYVTSVEAMRKAEEIEKLAHSVRDRMKN
jgi:hypothetical protein